MSATGRPMTAADADTVLRVNAEGIATGDATFRVAAPGWGEFDAGSLPAPRLVAGLWTLQANAFPENTASPALHEQAGFRVVGTRGRIGLMTCGPHAGSWRDTVLLERRAR